MLLENREVPLPGCGVRAASPHMTRVKAHWREGLGIVTWVLPSIVIRGKGFPKNIWDLHEWIPPHVWSKY